MKNLGDKIYITVPSSIVVNSDCPECIEGRVKVITKTGEYQVDCPRCYGQGYAEMIEKTLEIREEKIYHIGISEDGIEYNYGSGFFDSYEDAEKEQIKFARKNDNRSSVYAGRAAGSVESIKRKIKELKKELEVLEGKLEEKKNK